MKQIWHTHSPQETRIFGEKIGRVLQSGDLVCLAGTLGAGKTCLTGGIAAGWNALDRVSSPTFTLINEYHHRDSGAVLYHLDAYRLSGDQDALSAGIEDVLNSDFAVIIEWPERIANLLPDSRLWIRLHIVDETTREITIEVAGKRAEEILQTLQHA
jgi:tRNA threonylcarbamoyladenosine biosynthesis protein TsaE